MQLPALPSPALLPCPSTQAVRTIRNQGTVSSDSTWTDFQRGTVFLDIDTYNFPAYCTSHGYAMASVALVSLAGVQRFTLFTRLPLELRFIIWRFTLSPRIVEILTLEHCTTGFYSQAALPTALHVCRESRQAVEALYPLCFGSFLQPERVRFNFDLDILYLDISQEEDGLYRLFGILKETELARLKYAAIDEAYLGDGLADYSTIAGLKKAMRAMTNLKEMIVVRDITTDTSSDKVQMAFYAERRLGQDEAGWPVSVEELPYVQKEYAGWKLSHVYEGVGGTGTTQDLVVDTKMNGSFRMGLPSEALRL